MCRNGLLALAGSATNIAECRTALATALPAGTPARVVLLNDVDTDGVLRSALRAADDEIWLVRPDAYIAAIVHTPENLAVAARRALAIPERS